ncbi:MAG: hypothetical protein WDN76_04580 [Alphaproteobacteria bacterium]
MWAEAWSASTLALALDQAGLAVTVLDAAPPETQLDAAFDGRASAIAFASFRMWKTLGVADRLAGDFQRIENILVTDGRVADGLRPGGPSALRLHFDRRELDDAPEGEALGYMVENRASRRALMAGSRGAPGITMIAPARVSATVVTEDGVRLTLASGARIDAGLAISAEGKASTLRKVAGANLVAWNYSARQRSSARSAMSARTAAWRTNIFCRLVRSRFCR